MSGLRGMVKDGWHPKGKDGGNESWRGDFKGIGQVAGWVGKGKSSTNTRAEHTSRPLSSLRDPKSFPPPPKHINRHGGAGTSSPTTTTERRGLGAPLSASQIESLREEEEQAQREAEEAERPKKVPPPVPYRANTTGLSTDQFLPPPGRRTNTSTASSEEARSQPAAKPPKPSLPPRLPPRGAVQPSPSPSPPPAYEATPNRLVPPMNQGAINRLGNAGISVPSLGIDRAASSQRASPKPADPSPYSPQNELQARFARMNTSSSTPASPAAGTPTEGATVQHNQNSLRPAQSFSRESSSVSSYDARNAATAARNFRERHSEQIDSGKKKLLEMDKKYGISKRINSFIEDQKSPAYPEQQPPPHANAAYYSPQSPSPSAYNRPDLGALNNRKPPPPPPPPKKPSMQSQPVDGHAQVAPPPPLPLGTKPR
ncbi:hypothetical protein AJ79_06640 [Helicocarpus griseus UAMH5409]|uniref:Uncharacterized protein n=1 Tax=Helicocarpus griseus UAMH5409 TaxID=1447875 RepID=A0A2B7XAH7_9EURO|nr:hypothetical protein AJ79_06640 [Helicocarpus griseus UAMH5409]